MKQVIYKNGTYVLCSPRNLCAIWVNSFIKGLLPPYIGGDLRHEIARGERRANQELLQYGFELFWNNILSKVNFIFWIQSFYTTNMDPSFPDSSVFSIWSNVFIPEILSSCWGSKVITPDPRFYFRSINPTQFNIPILKFEHVTSLKDCCSVFLNQGKNFFSVLVFRITSYGRTATKLIDLICKQKNVARAAHIFVPFTRLQ